MQNLEVRLFPRTSKDKETIYHVGDMGEAKINVDLNEFTFFVYKHEKNPNDLKLILRPKTKNK